MAGVRYPKAATRLVAALLLSLAPGAAIADGGGHPSLRPALLAVTVNGKAMAEPALLFRGEDGPIYAAASALERWRLRLPSATPIMVDGETYHRLDGVPGLSLRLSEQDQTLSIQAGGTLFERQQTSFDRSGDLAMTPSATGGFVDYDLFVEHFRGATSFNGAAELGLFTRHGVATSSFVGTAGAGKDKLIRLDTAWTIDRPADLTTLRLGDGISAGGPGAVPFRFGGLRYARNFAVRPGFITMPLPMLSGSTAVPSVVDVYVNNVLQGSRELGPGAFDISDIPVQSGGGTVELVTRDLLGRQVVTEASYYASASLLRDGLHDFSYEIGFLREDFGFDSNDYGAFVASTSHRYGLSDSLTGEAHLQLSEDRQMAGVGINLLAFDLGQLGLSGSLSHSERGNGTRLAAAFDRQTSGLSFGARGEYASADFAFISMPDDYLPPRFNSQFFIDTPFLGGTIGASYIYRDQRRRDDESIAGIFANYRLTSRSSLHLFARHSVSGKAHVSVGAHVAMAFGGRRSGSASIEHSRGEANALVSFQDDPPLGVGGGYRVSANIGPVDAVEALYSHNLPMASLAAHVSHSGGSTGIRLSAAGGLGLVGGDAFASRSLGESFASVKVGDHSDVHVYADNQLIGVTGDDGTIVIPRLRPFEPNMIRIDETDLPLDVQIAATEIAVRPYARSGTAIHFDARRERGVLMQVFLEDGSRLPAGASVRVEGSDTSHVVASGGEVYVPDLTGRARLQASWDGQTCTFDAIVPDNDDPQPRLEGLICERAPVYAVR